MTSAVFLLAAEQPEEEFNFYTVSPGLPGFLTFFVLAVVGWLLFRSMSRHLRKVKHRAAQDNAAQAAAGQDDAPDAPRSGAAVTGTERRASVTPHSPDVASPEEPNRPAERP